MRKAIKTHRNLLTNQQNEHTPSIHLYLHPYVTVPSVTPLVPSIATHLLNTSVPLLAQFTPFTLVFTFLLLGVPCPLFQYSFPLATLCLLNVPSASFVPKFKKKKNNNVEVFCANKFPKISGCFYLYAKKTSRLLPSGKQKKTAVFTSLLSNDEHTNQEN